MISINIEQVISTNQLRAGDCGDSDLSSLNRS